MSKPCGPIIIPPTIRAITQGKCNLLSRAEEKSPTNMIRKNVKNGSIYLLKGILVRFAIVQIKSCVGINSVPGDLKGDL
jgi:hypothetical protein